MSELMIYSGRFCESDYENAFLSLLEIEGWQYLPGSRIPRTSQREVLYADDLELFLSKTNPDFLPEEVRQIMDNVRLVGAESEFAALHKVYGWMVDGVQFTPRDGIARMVALIDFENPEKNIFRAVNQFTIKEIIDTKSSFSDWLNNQIVRDQLKFDIKICLIKNGYPPQYSPEVFRKVMEQVENFEEHASDHRLRRIQAGLLCG